MIKKHGTHGELSVFIDADFPEEYSELESVFVEINNKLVPFFIEYIQIRGNKAVIKFEDVDDQESASDLKSCAIYLPLSTLPKLDDNQFYYHEIKGYTIEDTHHGQLGPIVDVVTTTKQDLIVVDYQGKEVLVPVNDEIIGSVDHENKLLKVTLPDGLLDVYLD
ncbi:ribosome maturation factor RimM [Fulvivirga lutea]|uniref:ribosome maturation factor RimM n=1 Tax=Fulvivirga lutea TaxID=2810512 RepID=UPI001EEC56F4|nr:ribosome maturation factor RimM [Fulvivirga lutea]